MKKLLLSFFIGLLLLLSTQPAYAQEKTGQQLIFEIETTLSLQAVEQHAPTGIMDKLVQFDELTRLNINRFDSTLTLDAGFRFSSVDSFRGWHQSKKVKNLLKKLREDAKSWRTNYREFNNNR